MIWWIAILPESNPMKTQLMVSYLELPWRLHAEQNALCGIFLHISPLLFFHPPLICSNFCLWSIQKARSLVHSKDSIAVNLIWCLLCKHAMLRNQHWELQRGLKHRKHSEKAFPELRLTGRIGLWKTPQASLGQNTATPIFLHHSILLGNSFFFFKQGLNERQRFGIQGGAKSPLTPWVLGEAEDLTQPVWMPNLCTAEGSSFVPTGRVGTGLCPQLA